MAREVKDVYLDADGNVVENAQDAVEMRRTVFEDGAVIESSVWYAEGAAKAE